MSITDELREWVHGAANEGVIFVDPDSPHSDIPELLAIADRIDERYSVKVESFEKYRAAVDAMRKEYVKLPMDADGVPIHVGDYVETLIEAFKGERGWVECLTLTEDGWEVDGDAPSTMRHYHAPTVEDVLREFAERWDDPVHYAKGELVEQYAAKLRLAGDE